MSWTSWDSMNADELTAMSSFLWEDIGRDNDVYDLKGVHTWAEKYRCTNCGFIHSVIQDFGHYNFCPKCGTRLFRNER